MVGPYLRVVGNMVIPNERLAPEVSRDVREMLGRVPIGNDLLAGPKEIDAGSMDLPRSLK
jgi:hypothetical protein